MTRKFLWGVIIVLLVTNLTTLAIWMNERNGSVNDLFGLGLRKGDPVATIGDQDISYEVWAKSLEGKYGKQVLKDLVNKDLVFRLAEREGININEKLLERELSLLFTMEGVLTKEEISKKEKEWEKDVTYHLYLKELLTKDIAVSDQEIEEYYSNYKGQYEFEESIQLSHIVVNDTDTADKVISELEDGYSFSALAKEYSLDESSRNDGGYLGFFTKGSEFLPSDYYERAVKLEEHSYSPPFITDEGVVILYLHRLLPSVSFSYEEIKPHIKREIALEQVSSVEAGHLWEEFGVNWIYE